MRAGSIGAVRRPSRQAAERTPGDVGAGGADGREVLGAQLAGQGDLEPGVVRLGDQRGERVGVEPVKQPAAVLDRRVEQAAR